MERRTLGSTNLLVSPLGFGTSPLGSMPETYGHEVDEQRALQTLHAMFESPVNLIDSSRNYGEGRSEQRVGKALATGTAPSDLVLSTKLDRSSDTGRFDAARARESFEESLEALGRDRVDILHLHDPEHAADLDEIVRPGGAMDELFRLRDEGLATSVGLAMGQLELMTQLVNRYDFDVILNHNRYTLLNRSAASLFDTAAQRGIAVFNAAPYAGGVLAKGTGAVQRITYQDADEETLRPIRTLESLCGRHNIPLGALALQHSIRDPRITSTIIGVSRPERVEQSIEWAATAIPDEVWDELATLPYSTEDPEAGRDWVPG